MRPDEFSLRPSRERKPHLPIAQNQGLVSRPTDVRLPSTPRFSSPDEWPSASLPLPNPRRRLQGGAFAPRPDEGMQLGPRKDAFFPPASSLPRPDEEAQRPLLRHARNAPSAKAVPLVDDRPDAWVIPRPSSAKGSCASASFRYPDEHGPCCKTCESLHSASSVSKKFQYQTLDDGLLPEPLGYFLSDRSSPGNEPLALYGQSVGDIFHEILLGSGSSRTTSRGALWLSGGPSAITAAHVVKLTPNRVPWVVFGKYGESILGSNYSLGDELSKKRMYELGIPYDPKNSEIFTFLTSVINSSYPEPPAYRSVISNNIVELYGYSSSPYARYIGSKNILDIRKPDLLYLQNKDIAYFSMKSNQISYSLFPNKTETISLFPSHIYGHIPIQPAIPTLYTSPPYKGSLLSVWYNHNNIEPGQTYLSLDGQFFSRALHPSTVRFDTNSIELDEFFDLRSQEGASGGALVTPLFGGGFDYPDGYFASGVLHGRTTRFGRVVRLVSSLPSVQAKEFYSPSGYELKLHPSFGKEKRSTVYATLLRSYPPQTFVGGQGGLKRNFSCPQGYAVAGVLGSEIEFDPYREGLGYMTQEGIFKPNVQKHPKKQILGNFGVVCLPVPWKFSNDPLVDPLEFFYTWGFDKNATYAGGSIDLAILSERERQAYGHYRFGEYYGGHVYHYLNEYVSTKKPLPRFQNGKIQRGYQQRLAMCPPGFFLTDLFAVEELVDSHQVVTSIPILGCQRWNSQEKYYFSPHQGFLGSKAVTGDKFRWLRCPSGYLASGADISSGWFTDQIRLPCSPLTGVSP